MPRQYEHIKESYMKRGVSEKRAKSIAAATWNKHHPKDPLSNYVKREKSGDDEHAKRLKKAIKGK